MSYKTILVHVSQGAAADARVRTAASLARAAGAHLVGAAPTGISRFLPASASLAGGAPFAERCAALRQEATRALARFETLAAEEGLDSWESRLVEDEAGAGMALQARYCDLVVVGQAAADQASLASPADLPEYLLLTSGRPVLVVPADGGPRDLAALSGHALVAWDASVEASRAVACALPLLRAARHTTVLGFGEDAAGRGTGALECGRLATWLRRQDVVASAAAHPIDGNIGEALLKEAAAAGAGLLVMGGYGHARFRELLLGGVTATVLRSLTLPLLFRH